MHKSMASTMAPVATAQSPTKSKEMIPSSDQKAVELPQIRTSGNAVEKGKPLPTSLQCDFIPDDILLAITHPPPNYDKLGPPTRYRNLNTTTAHHKKAPANVWNYASRREKFQHLTKNTPCICGAGRDISFLYDVSKKGDKSEKPSDFDPSALRSKEVKEGHQKKTLSLPDTLIPDEYHVVKNKGVMGLEYYEEKFATQPEDHEKHLVQFPSMNPTSRYEVKLLKQTLHEMLEKAGLYEEDVELKGPTQMHNLLELIKKEQNIYNIIFHELIRQTSVECLERGELLSELRDKYSALLNKVPKQIKGLHEEILAQRALDRRLTEELLRFKTTISALTYELASVKEHDVEVTKEAKKAQEELKAALAESEKNAALLAEYHELYELQRKRLEKQVNMLAEEREIWSTVAYSLALKVMEEHSLNTCKRLHVSEKAWSKLAHHFTILLSDNDTILLTALQGYVDKWRDLVEEFNTNICRREEEMRSEMKEIRSGLSKWAREFKKQFLSKEGHLEKQPGHQKVIQLYNDLKSWEQYLEVFLTMTQESEKFGGDTVLTGQEYMAAIRNQMYSWTENAMKIFIRHQMEEGKEPPDQEDMMKMNNEIETMLNQFNIRLTGENGVATGVISLSNSLEQWDNRFNTLLHGSNPLPDQEWLRFYQLLDEWSTSLDDTIAIIGSTQKEEHRKESFPHREVTVLEMLKKAHKWVTSTINGVDSEDAKLVEAVGNLHTDMVKWMVQMLLRLAPDLPTHSDEAKEAVLLGSATVGQLESDAKALFIRLTDFTNYVTHCCKAIVTEDMQKKLEQRVENADMEFKALQKLGVECNEWISVAKIMLTELTGVTFSDTAKVNLDFLNDSKKLLADKQAQQEQDQEQEQPPSTESKDTLEKEGSERITSSQQEGAVSPASQHAGISQDSNEEKAATPPASADQVEECAAITKEETSSKVPPTPSDQQVDSTQEQADSSQEQAQSGQDQQPTETTNEAVSDAGNEEIEVIGYDANTYKKVLKQEPDEPPPHTGVMSIIADIPATPDTKRAYEALAALETLQIQLLATEERAQGAESKASTLEFELKKAQERIRALEREFGVKQEEKKAEDESVSTVEQSTATAKTQDAEPEKTDKPKPKPKDKSTPSSRSSSRASSKSKKK